MKLNIGTRRPPPPPRSALQRLEWAMAEADRVLARTIREERQAQALFRAANGLRRDWTPPPIRITPEEQEYLAAIREAERLVQTARP